MDRQYSNNFILKFPCNYESNLHDFMYEVLKIGIYKYRLAIGNFGHEVENLDIQIYLNSCIITLLRIEVSSYLPIKILSTPLQIDPGIQVVHTKYNLINV